MTLTPRSMCRVSVLILCVAGCGSSGDPSESDGDADADTDQSGDGDADGDQDADADDDVDSSPDADADEPIIGDIYLDANNGDDSNPCTSEHPCQTVDHAMTLVSSGDVVIMRPGHYGGFDWNLTESFTDWVRWHGEDPSNRPVLDFIEISCDSCDAYQYFDQLEVHLPRVEEFTHRTVLDSQGASYIRIENSMLHAEQLYIGRRAIAFQGNDEAVHDLVVRGNLIYHVVSGIRFQGTDILIENNEIHTLPGTMIGSFAGRMSDDDLNSAHTVTIRGNHLHGHEGDYPDEEFHEHFDEPAELHSSIIAIRGHHWLIENNEFHDIHDTVGIQLYNDDVDGVYDIGHVTIRENLIYDTVNLFQHATLRGPIVVEHNTIISNRQNPNWPTETLDACSRFVNPDMGDFSRQTFNIMDMYEGGEGTIVRDNLFVIDFGIANEPREDFDASTAHWEATHNFIYRAPWPNGNLDPSNEQICERIESGELANDFVDTQIFANPNYLYGHGERCGPGLACDFTPLASSIVCTMASDGGHVGAMPCL